MNRVHWIRDHDKRVHPAKVITHCGMEGWAAGTDEFTKVNGDRFEAIPSLNGVKCGRCLKSAERISNSPWGCKRAAHT